MLWVISKGEHGVGSPGEQDIGGVQGAVEERTLSGSSKRVRRVEKYREIMRQYLFKSYWQSGLCQH